MNKKYALIFISIISTVFWQSCKPETTNICIYGIDSLTNGVNGTSFRTFFDEQYKKAHQKFEPGYVHIDYATSQDLNIGYWKSSGLKNMTTANNYSIDPIKYSLSGRGIYGFNLSNEGFSYDINDNNFTKVRIYYLQRPDGGSFKYRFSNRPKETSVSQSMKGNLEIKYVELNKTSEDNSNINAFEINGNAAFYGAWFFNGDDDISRASVLNIAKGGMSLNKIMTLDSTFRRYWYSQFKPKLLLFNAGTNDRNNVKGDAFKKLMGSYIDDVLAASPDTNFTIVEPSQTADYKTTYAHDYTIKRKELADEKNIGLLDIPTLIGDYDFFVKNKLMLDGVHPNEDGFKSISKVTLEYLAIEN
jgi:hypothetical protein